MDSILCYNLTPFIINSCIIALLIADEERKRKRKVKVNVMSHDVGDWNIGKLTAEIVVGT